MSLSTISLLLGLAVIYIGERMLDGLAASGIVVAGGAAIVIGSFAIRVRSLKMKKDAGQIFGHKRLLLFGGVVVVGLVLYAVSTEQAIDAFGFTGEMALRWSGVFSALWATAICIGVVGTIVVDNALQSSPIMVPVRQVKRAMSGGLVVAFVLAMMFPLNFIADRHNERWDLSFFKTSEPGTATYAMIEQAESPFVVRVFQSPSSDVGLELMNYFERLKGPNLRVELVDLPSEPALSQKLKIRDNGYISVSTEAIEAGEQDTKKEPEKKKGISRAQTFKVGTEIQERETKDNLRKLDQQFQEALVKLIRGRLMAYVISGHGELTWKDGDALRKIKAFKDGIEQFNFRVKELAPSDGFAQDIPNGADVVLIFGPDLGLSKVEVESVKRYLNGGGSVILALEPEVARRKPSFGDTNEDATNDLLKMLGVELEPGVLVARRGIVPITKTKQDRWHLITDRFNTHPSVATMNSATGDYEFFFSMAGSLRETKKGEGKTTVTVQSPAGTWLDLDQNLEQGSEEKKESRPIAIASTGGSGDKTFRALVLSDASVFSDLAMLNPGNQRFVIDGLNWLTRMESISGDTQSEQDVKFQPRREDQTLWFYLTVLGLPLLILAVGWVRLRMRYQEST